MTKVEQKNRDQYFRRVAGIYRVFSNPKRLEMIFLLVEGEWGVAELLKKLRIRKSNLSQHIAVLRRINFIKTRKEGRNVFCYIANEEIAHMVKHAKEVLKDGGTVGKSKVKK